MAMPENVMERQPTVYLEDTSVYKCIHCSRYAAIPDDHAAPTRCPWGCNVQPDTERCGRCGSDDMSEPRYRRGESYCSLNCARVATGVCSDDSPGVEGTAEELGIAVYEGIDPSEVTVYEDGSHRGPPKFKETGETETDSTWMAHPMVEMFCPCGHSLGRRFVLSRPELDTVRCNASTATVAELRAALSGEGRDTHQQTITESVATDGGCNVRTGSEQ